MEKYNCNIKIKRIYSNTPVNIITDGPILESAMIMLPYMFYLEFENDFDIPPGSYNSVNRQYWISAMFVMWINRFQ